MFYLTFKSHDNRVNTFGFMERGKLLKTSPPAQELQKNPGGIGLKLQTDQSKTFSQLHAEIPGRNTTILSRNTTLYCGSLSEQNVNG